MRRIVLLTLGILLLATGVRLVFPPDVAAASSGKIIYSFGGGTDGAYPESDLIMDAAGNLYGTTNRGGTGCYGTGCGTVFELVRTKDGWKHQVLYSFAGGTNDGADPTAGLVFDSAGNLYGTTAGGGGSNCDGGGCGTVFKLARNSQGGWSESVLFSFTGTDSDGWSPNSDLIFDTQGNLYGTADGGTGMGFCGGELWGEVWCGIVFKLTPNSDGTWKEATIYDFQGAPDAAVPVGPIILDTDGSFYGATEYGGTGPCVLGHDEYNPPAGCGALYKLTPSGGGWTETVIYSFLRGQGSKNPSGGLIVEKPDLVLGTSLHGGDGVGAFFQIAQTKKGWEQTVLYRFYGDPDGENPVGRLAMGREDNLFGVTVGGGANGTGTVFELERTTRGWKERVLFNLSSTYGFPQAGPVVGSQGDIYGTLSGYYDSGLLGAVYEVVP